MAERQPAGVYCVGCGSDLTSRSTDRRSLQSSASEHVATVWKALLEHMVDQEGSDTDIDVDEIVSGGRMCRKCFTAYERYHTLEKSLLSNLKKTLGLLPSTLSSSTKRLRVESRRPAISEQASSSTSVSPDVTVNYLHFYVLFRSTTNHFIYRSILDTNKPRNTF